MTSGGMGDEAPYATRATYEQPELTDSKQKTNLPSSELKLKEKSATSLNLLPPPHANTLEEADSLEKKYPAMKTLGSLLLVMGIFACVAYWIRRTGGRKNQIITGELWEILGRGQLSPKHGVQLVRLGKRLLLVGHSSNEMRTLAEITDPEEVEYMLSICDAEQSQFPARISKKIRSLLSGHTEQGFAPIDQNSNPAYVGSKDV